MNAIGISIIPFLPDVILTLPLAFVAGRAWQKIKGRP